MASASSSSLYDESQEKTGDGGKKKSPKINFYESMYHFRKMFPDIDSDVIETVLRSNEGAVDDTVDQLLTLSLDCGASVASSNNACSSSSISTVVVSATTQLVAPTASATLLLNDAPPSYHEFMATCVTSNSSSEVVDSARNDRTNGNTYSSKISSSANQNANSGKATTTVSTSSKMSDLSSTANISSSNGTCTKSSLGAGYAAEEKKVPSIMASSFAPSSSNSSSSSNSPLPLQPRMLIGELDADFLRVRLTAEQVRKFKASIKKAKRNELAAILNNVSIVDSFRLSCILVV